MISPQTWSTGCHIVVYLKIGCPHMRPKSHGFSCFTMVYHHLSLSWTLAILNENHLLQTPGLSPKSCHWLHTSASPQLRCEIVDVIVGRETARDNLQFCEWIQVPFSCWSSWSSQSLFSLTTIFVRSRNAAAVREGWRCPTFDEVIVRDVALVVCHQGDISILAGKSSHFCGELPPFY